MKIRIATLVVLGAALSLEAAAASAQDTTKKAVKTTRSTRRIPVTKEARGEVVPPRVDTVTVYKTDTLRVFKTDTMRLTTTTTRTDTLTVTNTVTVPEVIRRIGGLYFGLAGGASFPAANSNDAAKPGWRVEVPFGIDPKNSPLGLRFNLGYSKYDPHSYYANVAPSPTLMNADADLKLRIPGVDIWRAHFAVYGVAGGTYNRYKDMAEIGRTGVSIGESAITTSPLLLPSNPDHDWRNTFGWNAGGGAQLGFGATNLFIESRYSRFEHNATVSHVPLVLGVMWY